MLLALQYLNYALVVFCLPDSRNKSQDCLFVLCCYNEDSGGVNIDPHYKEQFTIPDGDKIRITLSSGEHYDRECRYIDDYHLEVGDNLYHICEFAERMEQNGNTVIPLRSSLPEQCYVYLPTSNEIGIIKKGETGYYKTDLTDGVPGEMKELADSMNRKLGVTKGQAEAMKAGSMFGWKVPAADPKNYDENGKPMLLESPEQASLPSTAAASRTAVTAAA